MNPIETVFQRQRQHQWELRKTSARDRIDRLKKFRKVFVSRLPQLREALQKDLNKNPAETDATEIMPILMEIQEAIHNLSNWMRPKTVRTPLMLMGTRSEIHYEPKGVVLVIGAWNYPLLLTLDPLIAAVAAGNCVMVKPSELTPHASHCLKELIQASFNEKEVALFEGDAKVAQQLLVLEFDHIFFTGSTRVGRIVMEAAAKNLASVTLELGGKSPAVVLSSAHIKRSAEQIVWGKFINGGQTCVAPDYVLVHEKVHEEFLSECQSAIKKYYGVSPLESPDYCRIVSEGHYQRLKKMLVEATHQGAKIEMGGNFDDEKLKLSPTVLTRVPISSALMSEEIFGPLLPVMTYHNPNEIEKVVRALGRPLASYIFSEDDSAAREVLLSFPAGGSCINATVTHLANPELPFGGVGASGMGSYHGLFGFRTFSHERAVLSRVWFDPTSLLRPPYGGRVRKMIKVLLKYVGV